MAADAGWSTFASDVQQLLGLSSTGQSKLQVMSPLDPSPVPQQRPAFSLASPALLQLSETQRIEQYPHFRQPLSVASSLSSDPLPVLCQSAPQISHAPSSCDTINRAFQLRNDSDVLVRLILRDDQGGGEGFCHVDTLLAPRTVFPALRRGFHLPARPFFVVLAWNDSSRVLHHAMYRLPGDENCSFLCAIESGSGRADGVGLSLVPQLSVDTAGKVKILAGNVECESLFLISRGSAIPRPQFADAAGSPPAYSSCSKTISATAIKAHADPSIPPSIPSTWSQSTYGSKRVQFSKTVLTHQISPIREYGFSPTTADELVELDKDFAFTYPGYPSSPCTSWPMC